MPMDELRVRQTLVESALEKVVDLTNDLKTSIAVTDSRMAQIMKNGENLEEYLNQRRDVYDKLVIDLERRFGQIEVDHKCDIEAALKPLQDSINGFTKKYYIGMGILFAASWVIGGLLIPLFEGTGLNILSLFKHVV
jgi:hypothetical protein